MPWAGYSLTSRAWLLSSASRLRKLPADGFWGFAHESRTDFSMVMGSLFLLLAGPGPLSLNEQRARRG